MRSWRAGALALLVVAFTAHADGFVLEDDDGALLRFTAPAERVVALAPHLAEMMFDIDAGDRLVGTVEWSDHPPAARAVPRIGDSFRIDIERVVALEPDVALAWGGGTPVNIIERLRALGVQVAVLTPRDLESIPRHLEWLGRMTGNEDAAAAKSTAFETRLAALRRQHANAARIRVFYQVSAQPLFTIGAGHTISELIAICGGENIFLDLDSRAHAVSREAVIARNPQVIVAGQYAGSAEELSMWRRWEGLAATRTDNLFAIDAERIARPTAGILDGGEELCATLATARMNIAAGDD